MQEKRFSHFVIMILTFLFIAPPLLSWLLYAYRDSIHFAQNNHGHLIKPPLQMMQLFKIPLPVKKQWQILLATQNCNDTIKYKLYEIHQLRIALGENQQRVQLKLVSSRCQQRGIDRITINAEALRRLARLQFLMEAIYLVDPLGNIFMSYPLSTESMTIYADLKHVLGVSQIG